MTATGPDPDLIALVDRIVDDLRSSGFGVTRTERRLPDGGLAIRLEPDNAEGIPIEFWIDRLAGLGLAFGEHVVEDFYWPRHQDEAEFQRELTLWVQAAVQGRYRERHVLEMKNGDESVIAMEGFLDVDGSVKRLRGYPPGTRSIFGRKWRREQQYQPWANRRR